MAKIHAKGCEIRVEKKKAIVNGKLVLENMVLENKVLIYSDRIIEIADEAGTSEAYELLDAKNCYVSPGFIDIHIHGAFGHDVMYADASAIKSLGTKLLANGVTGYLPTTITESRDNINAALSSIRKAMKLPSSGAKVLGAHLEGPFINPKRKGAHNERYIIKPDYTLVEDYLDVIKIITIAPEVDEEHSFIKRANGEAGIVMSIGHTDADYEETLKAIKAGAKSATHIFNAMTGLNHREPGVVGAVLSSRLYCELIADMIHVHPALYSMLISLKGIDRLILVTDSISAACIKHGCSELGYHKLGGLEVTVDAESARLKDGTLAGSILRLNHAVRNILLNTDISLPHAIRMVSLNPAELLRIAASVGSIAVGKAADLVIFDKDVDVKAAIVGGQLLYRQ